MKAWRIEQHGGLEALRIEEMPAPEPGPGEVRLRVRAVGLNHLDLWVRRGVPGHKYPLPLTPGSEISGTVDAIGPGVRAWKPGDRALAAPGMGCGLCEACGSGHEPLCRWYGILGEMRDGGCAEFVLLPERQLLPHP
ncbi:MAG: alcohol dehydrogenase catalytic domain-containing protein, partial [Candidatus Eisenbacteria bacterium]|nr:alcohol dehydrogenase catalytic domain-containing protein [Candidatus Eisenbacteria bacterium]